MSSVSPSVIDSSGPSQKRSTRLSLNKDTLRALGLRDLNRVQGGSIAIPLPALTPATPSAIATGGLIIGVSMIVSCAWCINPPKPNPNPKPGLPWEGPQDPNASKGDCDSLLCPSQGVMCPPPEDGYHGYAWPYG
jgi:hypothetical protein